MCYAVTLAIFRVVLRLIFLTRTAPGIGQRSEVRGRGQRSEVRGQRFSTKMFSRRGVFKRDKRDKSIKTGFSAFGSVNK